jgi:hypothetical protein
VNWHLSQFPADPHAAGEASRNPRFLVSANSRGAGNVADKAAAMRLDPLREASISACSKRLLRA